MRWMMIGLLAVAGGVVGCAPKASPPPHRPPAEWWKAVPTEGGGKGATRLIKVEGKIVTIKPDESVMTVKVKGKTQVAWWDAATVFAPAKGESLSWEQLKPGTKLELAGVENHGEILLRQVVVK